MSQKEQKVYLALQKQLTENISLYKKELDECETENTQKKELLIGFLQKLEEQMVAIDQNIQENTEKIQQELGSPPDDQQNPEEQLKLPEEQLKLPEEQLKLPEMQLKIPEKEIKKFSLLSDLSKSVISASKYSDDKLKQRNLVLLFNFYLKLLYSPGVIKEFGSISHDLEVMSFGKYIVMCRQLGILDNKSVKNDEQQKTSNPQITPKKNSYAQKQDELRRGLHRLNRQEVTAIFKSKSAQLKEINFKEFQYILKEIGWMMYNNNQSRSEDECQQLFQTEILKLHLGQYVNYLQSLNSAFFSNEKIGKFDQIQKKDIDEHKRMLIEEWRFQKSQNVTDRSNVTQNSKPLSYNLQRKKLEKQNLNYSALDKQKSSYVVNRFQQQMTWEGLTKLSHIDTFLDKNDPFNPQELIEEAPELEQTQQISMKKRYNEIKKIQISKSVVNLDNRYLQYGSREQEYISKPRSNKSNYKSHHNQSLSNNNVTNFTQQKNISNDIFKKIKDLEDVEKQKYSLQKLYPRNFIQY